MATSLRSYRPSICWPSSRSSFTSSGKSMGLMRSMPTESVCATRYRPKRSTVRPGNRSASPKMTRQLETSPLSTVLRYSHAWDNRRR